MPAIAGVVGAGIAHAVLAALLWDYVGHDSLVELWAVKPLNGLYIGLGLFLLGAVPAALYVEREVVSPGVIVVGLLVASTAATVVSGPARAPAGGPTPFGLYVLAWIGVLALAGLSARVEARRGRRLSG